MKKPVKDFDRAVKDLTKEVKRIQGGKNEA